MKRNHLFSTVMMVAALGAAACGDRAGDDAVVVEQPMNFDDRSATAEPAPAVTEGAIIMDTSAVGTVIQPDTAPRP